MEQVWMRFAELEVTTTHLLAFAVGLGVFAVVFGVASAVTAGPTPQQRRIRAFSQPASDTRVVTLADNDPEGALRLFVPLSGRERGRIARLLRQAGIHRPNAVRVFFLVRSILSVTLPAVFISAAWAGSRLPAPVRDILGPLNLLSNLQVFAIGLLLVAVGFFGPSIWLKDRVAKRRTAIWRGMPNAMDLLRVAVEAGLGFDAAVLRVARELSEVCPPLAEEFTILLLEIQAGKPRDKALNDFGRRTGVDEVAAFANMVLQSAEFGTPVSEALEVYSAEMRFTREMKAQEKANKLPVKMSGVLAAFMMPILLLVTAGPVVLRWIAMLGGQ